MFTSDLSERRYPYRHSTWEPESSIDTWACASGSRVREQLRELRTEFLSDATPPGSILAADLDGATLDRLRIEGILVPDVNVGVTATQARCLDGTDVLTSEVIESKDAFRRRGSARIGQKRARSAPQKEKAAPRAQQVEAEVENIDARTAKWPRKGADCGPCPGCNACAEVLMEGATCEDGKKVARVCNGKWCRGRVSWHRSRCCHCNSCASRNRVR